MENRSEAQHAIAHLDSLQGLDWFQQVKRRSFALLEARPGAHLLDAGCGIGDDALALAQIVGRTGRVVGVDCVPAMVAEACRRHVSLDLPLEYAVGDVHRLDFADHTFDGCRRRIRLCISITHDRAWQSYGG